MTQVQNWMDCDRELKRVTSEITRVKIDIDRIERGGSVALSWEQKEKLSKLYDESRRLNDAKLTLKDLRAKMKEEANDRWAASFKLAAKEILDRDTFMRLVARADEIETQNETRRIVGEVGSALGVRGSSGGMKQRDSRA